MLLLLFGLALGGVTVDGQPMAYRKFAEEAWRVQLPSSWHWQLQNDGDLFSSSKATPPYTSRIGGFPESGSATLFVRLVPSSESPMTVSFDEWVEGQSRGSRACAGMPSETKLPAGTRLAIVCSGIGARPKSDFRSYLYFLERYGHRFFLFLQYNDGDPRAREYLDTALRAAMSIRKAK